MKKSSAKYWQFFQNTHSCGKENLYWKQVFIHRCNMQQKDIYAPPPKKKKIYIYKSTFWFIGYVFIDVIWWLNLYNKYLIQTIYINTYI